MISLMTTKNNKTARMPLAAQRIAIAEACGWQEVLWSDLDLISPREARERKVYCRNNAQKRCEWLPDYLNDLNAMRDVEMVLEPDQITDYLEWLGMCSGDDAHQVWAYVHATAAQRAEAFLLTIGKWESAK